MLVTSPMMPGVDRGSEVAEVGSPASVLIHRELHRSARRRGRRAARRQQIQHERFLTQHVLSRAQRGFDDCDAFGGVQRNIDDLDVVLARVPRDNR